MKLRRKARMARRWLLVPVEWIGIAVALAVILPLSRRVLFIVCDVFSRVMYRFDRRGKRRALDNLRIIRGTCTGKEGTWDFDPDSAPYRPSRTEELIIRRSYRNMVRTVGYAFWTMIRARRRCAATGVMSPEAASAFAGGQPVVAVSGHIGCWEILSQMAFLSGRRTMSVAKDIGTGGMTRLLMAARCSIGQEIVSADGALKKLLGGIREGKTLGLLVDQKVSPRDGGVWVRFFGRPMPVTSAPAFFAAKAKVPLLVAWSRPLRDGRYRFELLDVISPAEARDIRSATQRCACDLETVIRRHPSCWTLNYNPFKKRPSAEEISDLVEWERGREKGTGR